MPIDRLRLTNVGPFDDIEFEFDSQVNVFTGPNNSGKSSALWALAEVTVYPFQFPDKLLRSDLERDATFSVSLASESNHEIVGPLPIRLVRDESSDHTQGIWTLDRFREHVSDLESLGFSKFIPALRWSTDYRSPGPTVSPGVTNGTERGPYPRSVSSHKARHLDLRLQSDLESENASLVSDEAVIQEIIDLDYRSYIKKEPRFRRVLDEIGEVSAQITDGFITKFAGVNGDSEGYFPVFHTVDGDIPLNTLSQGTQSIIQWLAHLLIGYAEYYDFPDDMTDKPGVLIIDEIDAHLHPSWQRRIIPTLTERFPNLQIFCSTHSPLMLAGLKEGQIQILRREEDGRVVVSRNEYDIIGWMPDEVLRYVLDMPNTTDLQTVGRMNRLEKLQHMNNRSPEEEAEFQKLRHTINRDLISGPTSAQIERFAETMREVLAKNPDMDAAIADAARPAYRGE